MPEHVSDSKGSLMLGYLKDGSDDEHLGEFAQLCYSSFLVNFSLNVHRSTIKNIPWLKVLILRMVPCPSNALKLIPVKNILLFVSPHGYISLDGLPRLTLLIKKSIRRFWKP